jgi:hypothetical protein
VKKIGSLTQTYDRKDNWSPDSDGKDRSFLLNYQLQDVTQVKLRQLVDVHLYSFHNVKLEKAKKMATLIKDKIPRTQSLCYYDVLFSETVRSNLLYLKNQGVTDVLWIQDDDFFVGDNEQLLFDLIEYYKSNSTVNHVSLFFPYASLKPVQQRKSTMINDALFLYESRATDFHNTPPLFAMDNSPFICNLELLCTAMYDKHVFDLNIERAYDLENYVRFNSLKNDVTRCTTNHSFFETFNVVGLGGSLGNAEKSSKRLQDKFGKPVHIQ